MGQVKTRSGSLKKTFFIYALFCLLFSFLGSAAIGVGNNYLQSWYAERHALFEPKVHVGSFVRDDAGHIELGIDGIYYTYEVVLEDEGARQAYEAMGDEGVRQAFNVAAGDEGAQKEKYRFRYLVVSSIQVVLTPLWVVACMAVTGILFCRRELEKPISILLEASQKISENQLDFEVAYEKPNELGQLCAAFDKMRQALDANNRETWRSLEERRRLNAAFSHDLRTPLTVLRGYNEFLEKYVPRGQVSEEKLTDILGMMHGQIQRLENYTCKMSAVQKLEDIAPTLTKVSVGALEADFRETGRLICGDKEFDFRFQAGATEIRMDLELAAEVYENLLSNSARYADEKVTAEVTVSEELLAVTVTDDGPGFSEQALQLAANPFYREESQAGGEHFGLGLYLCRVICEKFGGTLKVANREKGASVTASFPLRED